MAHDQALTIAAAAWSPAAADILTGAAPRGSLPDIRHQVESGRAALFEVSQAGAVVAAFVLRLDPSESGTEGVIVAGAGRVRDIDLTVHLLPHIEARFNGCKAIRMHTDQPAVARKLARHGYGLQELVLRKDI